MPQETKLIDCPYYKEFSVSMPAGSCNVNCWGRSGWDDYPCNCRVPGQTAPICNPKTNGYIGETFKAKVDKNKLEDALDAFRHAESLLPENIVKRLDVIERQMRSLK